MLVEAIEKDGCTWVCIGKRVIMFIDKDGTLHAKGDIVAGSDKCRLPDPILQNEETYVKLEIKTE